MLRPQDSPTRDRRCMAGLWRFRADPDGVGREERWFAAPLADARDMPVPASYNDIVPGRGLHDHVGEVWYQTRVRVPHTWGDQRIVLRFDSATHRATVWVDGQEVVAHEGGYTPFEADVTELARPGAEVLVTAAVDNVLTWETIPPGIVVDTPHGRRQRYMHDFFNYAGLHRPVWLYAIPHTHLADLRVTTAVDDPLADPVAATVAYHAEVAGDRAVTVRARLLDADGVERGSAEGAQASIALASAQLWRPGEGYQYALVVELVDAGSGDLVDSYRQLVGIRTVEIRGTEFLINGTPFYFRGFGMHEDHAVLGKGQENAAMVHDFELLAWIGANSFRTSHYPYSEEILDYADAHGIVVIGETAAVGMNAGVAAVLGTQIDRVYGPEAISDRTAQTHAQAIRELVERDRNRPSVVIWSIANEPESHTDDAVRYFEPLFALARSLDDTRPVGFVNVQFSPAGQCKLTPRFADLVMINRYYGWYVETGDLANAEDALDAELTEWAKEGKPILVTEFGADTVAGLHALTGALWSEEFQTEIVAMSLRVFDRHPAVQGEHLWNFADFQTSLGIVRADGNKKGAFTRDRRPKAVAHMLRRRWTGRSTPGTPQD